jgi:hypothetical protein
MTSPVGVGLVGVTGGGGSAAADHVRHGGARKAKVCDWVPCDPMVEAIRKGLNEANERLKELSESIGKQVLENGKDFNMESILEVMIEDFENRWGDDLDTNKYSCRLGTNRGQPCGYTKEQILCFTLDPRMVHLTHVKEHQEETVTSLGRPMSRADCGGSHRAGLLCICSTPCSDLNSSN